MLTQFLCVLLTVAAWAFFMHARELWDDRKYVISALCYLVCALALWLGMPTPKVVIEMPAPATEQANPFANPAPQKYRL